MSSEELTTLTLFSLAMAIFLSNALQKRMLEMYADFKSSIDFALGQLFPRLHLLPIKKAENRAVLHVMTRQTGRKQNQQEVIGIGSFFSPFTTRKSQFG